MGNQGSTLRRAAADGDIAIVIKLATPDVINDADQDGWTALHYAALKSRQAVAKELLTKGAAVDPKDKGGRTPLHVAATRGHREAVQLLVEAGADPNSKDVEHGMGPLHKAAATNDGEVCRLLLAAGADANARTCDGSTPGHVASEKGHMAALTALLAGGGGAGAAQARRGDHTTPLDVGAADLAGRTALHLAAQQGQQQCVLLLMANSANPRARDADGNTPGLLAWVNNHADLARLLEPDAHYSQALREQYQQQQRQRMQQQQQAQREEEEEARARQYQQQQQGVQRQQQAGQQQAGQQQQQRQAAPVAPAATAAWLQQGKAASAVRQPDSHGPSEPPLPQQQQQQPSAPPVVGPGGDAYPVQLGQPGYLAPPVGLGTHVSYPAFSGYQPTAPPLEQDPQVQRLFQEGDGRGGSGVAPGAPPMPTPSAAAGGGQSMTISQVFSAQVASTWQEQQQQQGLQQQQGQQWPAAPQSAQQQQQQQQGLQQQQQAPVPPQPPQQQQQSERRGGGGGGWLGWLMGRGGRDDAASSPGGGLSAAEAAAAAEAEAAAAAHAAALVSRPLDGDWADETDDEQEAEDGWGEGGNARFARKREYALAEKEMNESGGPDQDWGGARATASARGGADGAYDSDDDWGAGGDEDDSRPLGVVSSSGAGAARAQQQQRQPPQAAAARRAGFGGGAGAGGGMQFTADDVMGAVSRIGERLVGPVVQRVTAAAAASGQGGSGTGAGDEDDYFDDDDEYDNDEARRGASGSQEQPGRATTAAGAGSWQQQHQGQQVNADPDGFAAQRVAAIEAELDRRNGWIRGGTLEAMAAAQAAGGATPAGAPVMGGGDFAGARGTGGRGGGGGGRGGGLPMTDSESLRVHQQQLEIAFLKQQLEALTGRGGAAAASAGGSGGMSGPTQQIYTYQELHDATGGFAESACIGRGGYGCVYRGMLHHTPVAVKMLHPGGVQGVAQFQAEVDILSRVRHPHVVLLLGSCPEAGAIVYEMMDNGSLEDALGSDERASQLSWAHRLKVALDVSTALLHLHHARPQPILHRDVKPANVLLDASLGAKLADVGLARMAPELAPAAACGGAGGAAAVSTVLDSRPMGTLAYSDPVYLQTGQYGPASDVYSLGVTLLQMLTGRPDPVGIIQRVEQDVANLPREVVAAARATAAAGGAGAGVGPGSQLLLQQQLPPRGLIDRRMMAGSNGGGVIYSDALALALLALQCCRYYRQERPNLERDVLPCLTRMYQAAAAAVVAGGNRGGRGGGLGGAAAQSEPPSVFVCPITQDVMSDPVVASDGYTYERPAIELWFRKHSTSPLTNLPLQTTAVVPNHALRSAIREWQQLQRQAVMA